MSVYDQKLSQASVLLSEHNSRVPNPEQKLDWEAIKTKIVALGGTNDDTLREMSWEDLQECGIPKLLARQIANQVFRKSADTSERPISVVKASTLSFLELFTNYDPTGERNPAVTERLKNESGGKRCVVFNQDGTVNAEESVKMLRDLRDFPEKESVSVGGKLLQVLKVGESLNQYFDENPLFPGQKLRNGICDISGRSWAKVPHEARQILFLAVTGTEEIEVGNAEDAHRILDIVECDDPVGKVQARYQQAALSLQKLNELQRAPTLKIARKSSSSKGPNDPFFSQHKRT